MREREKTPSLAGVSGKDKLCAAAVALRKAAKPTVSEEPERKMEGEREREREGERGRKRVSRVGEE